MSKITIIYAVVLSFFCLSASAAMAGETNFTCPDLSTAQQVGACPSDKELKEGYAATCPSAMGKRNECRPFAAYVKSKGKSLWAVLMGDEEFLSYVRCGLAPETVRASKVQNVEVKCSFESGRCAAQCGYENDFTLKLRFKGECRTANAGKIECKDNPAACVVSCDLFD